MVDCNTDKVSECMAKGIHALMLALFLPVLFCVLFIGNKMDYFESVKAEIIVPNVLLTLIALAVMGVCLWLLGLGRRVRWEGRLVRYVDLGLVALFVGFFFVCLALSKETVFDMSMDQGIVRREAIKIAHGNLMGYFYEMSIDYNNLPIIYILARLYGLAESWAWFSHDPEYLWVIVGCLSVTVAGFCCCKIVERLTKNPIAVLLAFGLYLLTAGLCPWKYIPYTDSYGILFPALSLLLYLYGRDCKQMGRKMAFCFLALLSGAVGGFIKPNAYIASLALIGVEGLDFLVAVIQWIRNKKTGSKEEGAHVRVGAAGLSLVLHILFFFVLYWAAGPCMEHVIRQIGLDHNEELEKTPQYVFFMSTNETTTGSFTAEDYGVFGEFQYSKADRNAACMERAWKRIEQRGVVGTIYFCLKKLVKSFNDGTFAWTYVPYYEPFPENLAHDNAAGVFLRSLFMPDGLRQRWYDTLAELVWIFLLMGIPGIVLGAKRGPYLIFSVLIIGFLVYLMLFESGARYIYLFLPVFAAASACGMELMGAAAGKLCESIPSR